MRFLIFRSHFYRLLPLVVLLFLGVAHLAAQAPSARSTRDGVYTAEQAERGKVVFEEGCTQCHTARMWGTDWNSKSVADIYDFISQYMPEQAPGSLSAEQVRDVIAFFLSSNRLPAGPSELPATVEGLKAIRMERGQ